MKKLIAFVVALFAAGNLFALSGDVDFGMILGGGAGKTERTYYFYTQEADYKTGIAGIYGNFDLMFTENFGIFNDISFNIPFNSSYKQKALGITRDLDSFKATFFASNLLGVQGGFSINEKFRLLFGGGFDCAIFTWEQEAGFSYDYIEGLIYNLSAEETLWMFGLGAKAKAQYFFNDKIGINAGFVVDWYFVQDDKLKVDRILYTWENEEISYKNFFFFRPELGMTIKLF